MIEALGEYAGVTAVWPALRKEPCRTPFLFVIKG
jgi:hypothetical protein